MHDTCTVRLRAESAVTVQWIAERLPMGAPGYVHHLLYRQRKARGARVANIKTRSRAGDQRFYRLAQSDQGI